MGEAAEKALRLAHLALGQPGIVVIAELHVVVERVVADPVALGGRALEQGAGAGSREVLADHEEGRPDVVLRERVEHGVGDPGARPVVERQRDPRRVAWHACGSRFGRSACLDSIG